MKPSRIIVLVFLGVALVAAAQDSIRQHSSGEETAYRQPFTLRLKVDRKHFYEEKFDKTPYTQGGNVYIFPGEEFGLDLDIENGSVRSVTYQPDYKHADVTLKFTQEGVNTENPRWFLFTETVRDRSFS